MFTGEGAIGYVLMGYPRLSETFIASELHRVERAGVRVRLFVIEPVEERERGLRHPVVDAIAARPRLLVEPEDPAVLAEALLRVHRDRELAARMADAGRRTVQERFDGDVLARRLADLFREALA
jgi:glycosyltransferase involved in cell wall biosynthesis